MPRPETRHCRRTDGARRIFRRLGIVPQDIQQAQTPGRQTSAGRGGIQDGRGRPQARPRRPRRRSLPQRPALRLSRLHSPAAHGHDAACVGQISGGHRRLQPVSGVKSTRRRGTVRAERSATGRTDESPAHALHSQAAETVQFAQSRLLARARLRGPPLLHDNQREGDRHIAE